MSCSNPSLMKCTLDKETGALYWKFLGNGRYSDPKDYGNYESLETRGYFYVAVPCRHCLGCRIDYSRDWANRMCIELSDNQYKGIFVTLTYNNDHVPKTDEGVLTLSKRDCQLFMKRLRKYFSNKRIRFYLAGEYGPKTKRPHYHGILFGLTLSDFSDLRVIGKNELNDLYFSSSIFEKIWGNGFVTLSGVSYKTCAYVSRYVLKKHYSYNVKQLNGALPEFSLTSRRPGIGLAAVEDLLSEGLTHISLPSADGVHTFPLPKAIIKKGKTLPNFVDFCTTLQYDRFNESNDRLKSDLLWSEIDYDAFLRKNAKSLFDSIKLLPERK